MKLTTFALAIAAFVAPLGATAQPAPATGTQTMGSGMSSTPAARTGMSASGARTAARGDRTFVQKAAEGDEKEIALSRVALEKSSDDNIKRFAQMMVDDHTKAGDELKQISSAQGMAPSGDPKAKADAAASKLRSLSGAAFDRQYVQTMTTDHAATVKLFQTEARSGSNADLKGFAEKTLPTIQAHYDEVRGMKKR